MGNSGKIKITALLLLLASGTAHADGAALHNYTPDGVPVWANNPEFQDCGMKCLYLESAEKISIRSRHTIETINQMKGLKDGDEDKMKEIVPGFCDFDNNYGAGKETVPQCQVRWFKTQLPTLYQDRIAIKMNTDSAAELGNGQVSVVVNGNGPQPDPAYASQAPKPGLPMNAVDSDNSPKVPIVTAMEQYNDIHDRALANTARDPRLRQITILRQDIENTTNVRLEEFVKMRQILKDPSDPKAGTYSIVVTKPNGTPEYDMASYQKAQRNRMSLLKLDAAETKRLEGNLAQIVDLQRQQLRSPKNKEIYANVRASVLGAARRGLDKYKIPYSSSPTRARAPARAAVPANNARFLKAAVQSAAGVSDTTLDQTAGRNGDDQDINVQAQAGPGTRPYFTVGYEDNTLGNEIRNIEMDLHTRTPGSTYEP